MEDGAVLHS